MNTINETLHFLISPNRDVISKKISKMWFMILSAKKLSQGVISRIWLFY